MDKITKTLVYILIPVGVLLLILALLMGFLVDEKYTWPLLLASMLSNTAGIMIAVERWKANRVPKAKKKNK